MVHPLDLRPSAFWQVSTFASKRQSNKRRNKVSIRRATMAALALCVILFGTIVGSRYQSAQSHAASLAVGTLRVPMTVQRGDSLWSLAKRYGDPNAYILDRVDILAQANRMSAASSLMPGQRIVIPVSNPVEVSRLQQNLAKNSTRQTRSAL